LQSIKTEAEAFKEHQQAAFEAERERWAAAGQAEYIEPAEAAGLAAEADVPEGCSPVRSPISASVWNVAVEAGQRVEAGQKLMILEAMKTEIAVIAPRAGIVHSLACAAGALVWAGQTLLLLAEAAS
jgi:urea carboxylase